MRKVTWEMVSLCGYYIKNVLKIEDEKTCVALTGIGEIRRHTKGSRIVKAGEVLEGIYFLVMGTVKFTEISEDGNELVRGIYDEKIQAIIPNGFNYLQRSETNESVTALSECRTIYFHLTDLQKLERQNRNISSMMVNAYANAMDVFINQVHMLRQYQNDHAGLLKYMAEHEPSILANSKVEELAHLFGITRTQLSRIRTRIAKQE